MIPFQELKVVANFVPFDIIIILQRRLWESKSAAWHVFEHYATIKHFPQRLLPACAQ
jgi:hypothetical protein